MDKGHHKVKREVGAWGACMTDKRYVFMVKIHLPQQSRGVKEPSRGQSKRGCERQAVEEDIDVANANMRIPLRSSGKYEPKTII